MPISYTRENAVASLSELIAEVSQGLRHTYIAIDGLSGTGKSTLAAELAKKLGAEVIHMDDFYLPLERRQGERIASPGWNVDYERFRAEVARPFLDGKLPTYGAFRCDKQRICETVAVPEASFYIIEGCYAMHPEIPDFYDLRIVLRDTKEACRSRILTRNGEEILRRFDGEWFPLEEEYLSAYMICELADVIVEGDCSLLAEAKARSAERACGSDF
jgi:uridine kinase